jgi:hypothetical protein
MRSSLEGTRKKSTKRKKAKGGEKEKRLSPYITAELFHVTNKQTTEKRKFCLRGTERQKEDSEKRETRQKDFQILANSRGKGLSKKKIQWKKKGRRKK